MKEKQLRIKVSDIELGMFVSALDRPWQQTPFPVHGFYIRDLNELKQLKIHCDYIFIDTTKGISPSSKVLFDEDKKTLPFRAKLAPIKSNTAVYSEIQSIDKAFVDAQNVYKALLEEIDGVMNQAGKNCLDSISAIKLASQAFVDTIIANPDAFMWFCRTRSNNDSSHHYLLRSATWALLLARHLGLARGDMIMLTLGILLRDIGKAQLARNLVGQPDADRLFIDKGVELLKGIPSVHPKMVHIVKAYRERLNGSGIPAGLSGDDVPLLGKIAGIAIFYDEVIHPANEQYAAAPSVAVSRLYTVKDIEFQNDLVVEFIQAIGLYSTGTSVELSTGEVAIVVQQNYARRLKPVVMLLLDSQRKLINDMPLFDLGEDESRKKKMLAAGKKRSADTEKVDIVQDLGLADYPLDIERIRQAYIEKVSKKSRFPFFR